MVSLLAARSSWSAKDARATKKSQLPLELDGAALAVWCAPSIIPTTTAAGLCIGLFARTDFIQVKASPSSVSAFVLPGVPIQEGESC
jgi:hypothetical protein